MAPNAKRTGRESGTTIPSKRDLTHLRAVVLKNYAARGTGPVTIVLAVNMTDCPTVAGLSEELNVTAAGGYRMTSLTVALCEA